jgi:hypothetical protein
MQLTRNAFLIAAVTISASRLARPHGLLGVVLLGSAAALPAYGQDQGASGAIGTASIACQYVLASTGGGEKFFRTCISTTGNVVQFHSPQGVGDAINTGTVIEGYAVCDDGAGGEPTQGWHAGVHGWDSAEGSAGFGAPILLSQTATSVTIRRFTVDGVYRLDQRFTRDVSRRETTVQMTLTNVSPIRRTQVLLARYVDLDVDGILDNKWDIARSSVWARATGGGNGVTLNATTVEVAPRTVVLETFDTLNTQTKRGCFASPLVPPNSGDLTGRIIYPIGTLAAGATKTVRFVYRRQ